MPRLLDGDKLVNDMRDALAYWEATKVEFADMLPDHALIVANTDGYFEAVQDTIDEIEEGNYDAES